MTETATLIVGAGPAGLAVAGRLRQRGLPFEILEASDRVGNAWHEHYDRLHLHTVKELSSLPGLPFPADYPRYVPRHLLADYLTRYAEHFRLEPRFGEDVRSIRRSGALWHVETHRGSRFEAGQVVVATGVNRVPIRPILPGEEDFQGVVEHTKGYRRADPYAGQHVLVVGMGNTGAEVALDLCESGVAVALSVRGAVNIVPRDVLGRPTQRTALLLARLPNWLGDRLGTLLRRLTVGDLSGYGIETPRIAPLQQLRLYGKTPVVDLGTVDRIKRGDIRVFPEIQGFTSDGVVFADGRSERFDVVLLATGYRPDLEHLVEGGDRLMDRNGLPATVVGQGPWAGLYFVGFDNYRPGGVLGAIVRDSERVVEGIAAQRGVAAASSVG
ncbi:MAG: NAD(P)/FAD-dependent oxidoreductase [Gemmatimonadota bacterium]